MVGGSAKLPQIWYDLRMSSAEMDMIMDEVCEECEADAYLDMPDKFTQDAILIVAQV